MTYGDSKTFVCCGVWETNFQQSLVLKMYVSNAVFHRLQKLAVPLGEV